MLVALPRGVHREHSFTDFGWIDKMRMIVFAITSMSGWRQDVWDAKRIPKSEISEKQRTPIPLFGGSIALRASHS
ncbi:hypothetical protein GCM10011586_23710 [Silvibacterium dinghuense]|nr:hypothetical protein GCM10011586_23710 [Silvibacterium dinghuense]